MAGKISYLCGVYEFFKRGVKLLLPRGIVDRYKPHLRAVNGLFYRGRRVKCAVCGGSFSRFIRLGNGDLICPRCGSLPRTRRLSALLHGEFYAAGSRVLHFSPPAVLSAALEKLTDITYHTTDYANEFAATYRFDITAIDRPDASYDLVICYHVLEHIEADRQAMAEIYRILAPGGVALIQCPFDVEEIYENPAIQTPAGRLQAYGQEDHVRIYSATGLAGRLEQAGFCAEVRRLTTDIAYDTKGGETVIIARKRAN